MKPQRLAVIVALGLCACAAGLVDDAAAPPPPAKPVDSGSVPMPPSLDASHPETSSPLDSGADAHPKDAASEAPPPVVVIPPVVDGNILGGEYGVHTDGQNQQTSNPADPASTTWYMTWTETNLYVGVTAANLAEGVVIYLDHTPQTPSNAGTSADGSLAGVLYDNERPGALPFRADFVAYIKATYNEYRTADGADGWSSQTVGALTVQGIGQKREVAIPWSVIHPGGRPAAFSWLGYACSAGGYVYGAMPPDNSVGPIGTSAIFSFFYKVSNATPGSGTKPFAAKLSH